MPLSDLDLGPSREGRRMSFWELHEKLGQCYKALSNECDKLKRQRSTVDLDVLAEVSEEPSGTEEQLGTRSESRYSDEEMLHIDPLETAGSRHDWSPFPPSWSPPASPPPSEGGRMMRPLRKQMSKTDGALEEGRPGLMNRGSSMNQGMSLAQFLAGPRQMTLSRQFSASLGGRQASVDFNERVQSTSEIGQYLPMSLNGLKAVAERAQAAHASQAERAKGSTGTGGFLDDGYNEDRKVALGNIAKMERVVSRKSNLNTGGLGFDTSLAASLGTNGTEDSTSKFGEDLFQPRQCFMVLAPRITQRKISQDDGLRTQGSKILRLSVGTQKSHLGCDGKLVMTPGGISRAMWDALRMLCVIIDILVIPLRFFDMPADFDMTVQTVSIICLVFWTLDILVSFRTGYFEKGVLVMNSRKIALHYIRRWFLFDICVVLFDYILLGVDGLGTVGSTTNLNALQVIRMIRVGRLLKWNQMFASLRERFDSQYWITQMSIVNIIIQILLMYHVVACIFFGLGKLNASEGWIETYGLMNADFGYQYTTTLHWALCQLGMGSNIIEATNLVERLFGIAAVLFAIVTFSSLVSLMTSLLTSLHNAREEELHQFRMLRSFLVRNQISGSLSQRVKNFLQHSYTLQREAISETQVPLLSLLSKTLQGELQFARHQRSLNCLAFVSDALMAGDNLQHKEVAHDIAANAVSQTFLASSEVVFYAGNVAEHVFLATSGSLLYLQNRRKVNAATDTWIAEMCLWTPWSFVGDLVTQDLTVLVMVEQSSFCDTVCKSPDTQKMAKLFAEDYVANMNSYQVSTDLWQYPGDEGENPEQGRQWMMNLFGKNQNKRRNSLTARRASVDRGVFFHVNDDTEGGVVPDVPGANGLPGLDSTGLQVLQGMAQQNGS